MRKLAGIVVDMQEHFSELMSDKLIHNIAETASWFRDRGVPIVYTQHGTPDPPAEEATDVLVAWWGAEDSIKCGATASSLIVDCIICI